MADQAPMQTSPRERSLPSDACRRCGDALATERRVLCEGCLSHHHERCADGPCAGCGGAVTLGPLEPGAPAPAIALPAPPRRRVRGRRVALLLAGLLLLGAGLRDEAPAPAPVVTPVLTPIEAPPVVVEAPRPVVVVDVAADLAACLARLRQAVADERDADARLEATLALALDATCVEAWRERAAARGWIDDWTGAEADATRAVELDPSDASAWGTRAWARLNTKDHEGAIADATRAIELRPDGARAWRLRALGRAWLRLPGAVEDATRALELQPDRPYHLGARSFARLCHGDLAGALEDAERAVTYADNTSGRKALRMANAYSARAAARRRTGDLEGALADAERALEWQPDDPGALSGFAFHAGRAGAPERAIDAASRAIALDLGQAYAWNNRAHARLALGDIDGAASDVARSLALDARNPYAWETRAGVRLARADLAGAEADLRRALVEGERFASWDPTGARATLETLTE